MVEGKESGVGRVWVWVVDNEGFFDSKVIKKDEEYRLDLRTSRRG